MSQPSKPRNRLKRLGSALLNIAAVALVILFFILQHEFYQERRSRRPYVPPSKQPDTLLVPCVICAGVMLCRAFYLVVTWHKRPNRETFTDLFSRDPILIALGALFLVCFVISIVAIVSAPI